MYNVQKSGVLDFGLAQLHPLAPLRYKLTPYPSLPPYKIFPKSSSKFSLKLFMSYFSVKFFHFFLTPSLQCPAQTPSVLRPRASTDPPTVYELGPGLCSLWLFFCCSSGTSWCVCSAASRVRLLCSYLCFCFRVWSLTDRVAALSTGAVGYRIPTASSASSAVTCWWPVAD